MLQGQSSTLSPPEPMLQQPYSAPALREWSKRSIFQVSVPLYGCCVTKSLQSPLLVLLRELQDGKLCEWFGPS